MKLSDIRALVQFIQVFGVRMGWSHWRLQLKARRDPEALAEIAKRYRRLAIVAEEPDRSQMLEWAEVYEAMHATRLERDAKAEP